MGKPEILLIFPYLSMGLGLGFPASDSVCEGSNPSPAAKTRKALILLSFLVISRLFSSPKTLKNSQFGVSKVLKSAHFLHGERYGESPNMGKIWGKYGEGS